MLRAADLIEKHNDELAILETWDNGKPYAQAAEIEVPMFVRLIRYYAGMSGFQIYMIDSMLVPNSYYVYLSLNFFFRLG